MPFLPINSIREFVITYSFFLFYFCSDLRELKYCFVEDLRQCDRSTVADIVETGFELALRHSQCARFLTSWA